MDESDLEAAIKLVKGIKSPLHLFMLQDFLKALK